MRSIIERNIEAAKGKDSSEILSILVPLASQSEVERVDRLVGIRADSKVQSCFSFLVREECLVEARLMAYCTVHGFCLGQEKLVQARGRTPCAPSPNPC